MSTDSETAQLRRELQLREAEITLLKEATDAVSSQLDLDKVMQIIAERARILLNAETVLIPVLDEGCTEYRYAAGSGKHVEEIVGESLPLDFGICGWVWKHKRAWWRGVLDELDAQERNRWEQEAGSIILVPLFGKQHFLGGLAGINKLGADHFDQRDLELLTMFASQVSIAIENAMAYEQLQQEKDKTEQYQAELQKLNDELLQTNKNLEQLALYDRLTTLPNRNLLRDRIKHTLSTAERNHTSVSICLIDLDNFKDINDTLGHDVGDMLLRQVARRFSQALRECDTIGRLGGDEFAVILTNTDQHTSEQVAHILQRTLDLPFELQNNHYYIAASIGIALYPEHGKDVATLLKRADVAMYAAKKDASRIFSYHPGIDDNSPSKLAMMGELRKACLQKEFRFHYQPKLDATTGKVIGAEVLARWSHPDYGEVGPQIFIPLLEKTGLIKPFTLQLLKQAIAQCRQWHDAGMNLSVSINLSMHNLHDPGLPVQIMALLREHKLPRNSIILEITESIAMGDPRHLPGILAQLVYAGVELSIDDFGTGYSSLSYLKKLPVCELKIDKSFVIDMDKDKDNRVIVHSTIDLAHNLGLRVVVEGVETAEVQTQLQNIGADILQGFGICRPVAADEFIRFVERTNNPQEQCTTTP